MKFTSSSAEMVKCFDAENKQIVYMKCKPCPACGKWLPVQACGNTDRYCGWCGQRLKTKQFCEEENNNVLEQE